MKRLFILTLSILLLSFASAMNQGSNYSFEINTTDNLFWDAINNNSNMEGFSVFQEINGSNSIITFSTSLYMKPDNFTILLYSNITNEIIKEVHVVGNCNKNIVHINKTIIKEVPFIQYVENETIEYLNNTIEKECPNKTKELSPLWIECPITLFLLLLLCVYYKLRKKSHSSENLKNTDVRRFKKK